MAIHINGVHEILFYGVSSEPKPLFYHSNLLGRSNRVNAIIVVFEEIPEMWKPVWVCTRCNDM